jgi:hypothetical protein
MNARPSKPRFSGGFKTFSVSKSINRENRTESRLFVFSQGSQTKVFEYLWLKLLWDNLTKLEMELIYFSKELNSEFKFSILRSINIKGKIHVRTRLNILFPGGIFSRKRYQGFKRLNVEIYEEQRSLLRTTKFSGWIRSSSAKGSKRSSGDSSFLEALTSIEYKIVEEINWLFLLTVDDKSEISQWEFQSHPDEG